MAVNTYVGRQIARAKVMTLTVTTADITAAVTFTGGNGQIVAITPTSATTSTAASDFSTGLQAAGGVFSELQFSASGAVVTITGPSDGAIFTFSKSDAGTNSTALATPTAPLSPHDATDVINWSTGALPVDTVDSVVLEDSSVSILYNLTGLSALGLTSFTRRASYTGQIGLPTTNPLGFPEYRATELSVKSDTWSWESSPQDSAGQFRMLNTFSASAVTITIQGTGSNVQVGSEAFIVRGLPAASIVTVVGGSVCIAPTQGQACTVLTLTAIDSTVRVGPSATLSGTVNLVNCNAQVKSSWTTSLTMDGGNVEIAAAAAGVIILEAGTMTWHSTGNPGSAPVLGSGSFLDLSQAPAALTIAGTIQMYAGSTLNDPAGRGGNWAFKTVHCTLAEVTVVTKNDATYTKS